MSTCKVGDKSKLEIYLDQSADCAKIQTRPLKTSSRCWRTRTTFPSPKKTRPWSPSPDSSCAPLPVVVLTEPELTIPQSSCPVIAGGVAGMAPVGASLAGAAASATVDVAQAELEQARKGHGPEGYEDEARRKLGAAGGRTGRRLGVRARGRCHRPIDLPPGQHVQHHQRRECSRGPSLPG